MNLPNKLTILRIVLVPFILSIYLLRGLIGDMTIYLIGVLFILASLTDYFDGAIARKRNLVTTFGKFIDPLADKLLVTTTLIILSNFYYISNNGLYMWMPFWVVLIVVSRDLLISSVRIVAMSEGRVVAAKWSGKYKTAFTMITIIYYFFVMPQNTVVINYIGVSLTLISVLLTVYSAFDYFMKNKDLIFKEI